MTLLPVLPESVALKLSIVELSFEFSDLFHIFLGLVAARFELRLLQLNFFCLALQALLDLFQLLVFVCLLLPNNVQVSLALADLGLVMELHILQLALFFVEHRLS